MNRLLKSFGAVTAPAAVLAGALSTAQAADAPFAGEPRPPATFTQTLTCINGTPEIRHIDDIFQQMWKDYDDNADYLTLPGSSIRLAPTSYRDRTTVLSGDCMDGQRGYPIPAPGQDYNYEGDDKDACGWNISRVGTSGVDQNGTPARVVVTLNNVRYDVTYDTNAEIGGYWILTDDRGRQQNDGGLHVIPAFRESANSVLIQNERGDWIRLNSTFSEMLGSAIGTAAHPWLAVEGDCGGGAFIGGGDPGTPPPEDDDEYGPETFCRDENDRLIACDDTPRDPDAPPLPDPEMPVGDGRGDERADAGQHINTWAPAPVFA